MKRNSIIAVVLLILIAGGAWLFFKAPTESTIQSNDLVGADEWKGVTHLIGADYRLAKADAEKTLVITLHHYKHGKQVAKQVALQTGLNEKKGDLMISFLYDQANLATTAYELSLVNNATITKWPTPAVKLAEKDQFITDGTLATKTAISAKPVIGYAYKQADNKRVLSLKEDAALIGKYNQAKSTIKALAAYDDLYIFTAQFKLN